MGFIFRYSGYFLAYLILLTLLVGALGFISADLASTLVLLPYIFAFMLMARHYAKAHSQPLSAGQRFALASSCLMTFWLYSSLAGLVGLWVIQTQLNTQLFSQMWTNLSPIVVQVVFFLSLVSLILIGLGYVFLGKPLNKMQAHYHH